MRLSNIWTKIHKWIGLLIGIQVVLWVAGGLVMSWFPLNEVRGEHNIAEPEPVRLSAGDMLVPIGVILAKLDGASAEHVELRHFLAAPVYQVTLGEDEWRLYDARTAELLSPLSEDIARRVALADFKGDAGVISARLLDQTNDEYRGDLPVWQMLLDDDEDTHLYVSPQTGAVVARRNAVWRFYDFFWMLHIMDYKDRTNFNHPLIVWTSVIALLLSVSGIFLLFYRFSKRDFRWLPGRRRKT